MSDNLRRYRAIRAALTPGYPGPLTGTVARHLTTRTALISGIVGSKSTQLPHIAAHVPNGTQPESCVKRFARWVDNAHILEEVYFLPSADVLLLQATLHETGWSYACRTAMSTVATWEGAPFRLDALGACSHPGRLIELKEVYVTREASGPIMVLCCWAKGYQAPLYLVSNLATAEEAWRWYQKRFRIETFFADQKSRGFHLHQSHISDPQRLSRLCIAACLAYLWIVYLERVA